MTGRRAFVDKNYPASTERHVLAAVIFSDGNLEALGAATAEVRRRGHTPSIGATRPTPIATNPDDPRSLPPDRAVEDLLGQPTLEELLQHESQPHAFGMSQKAMAVGVVAFAPCLDLAAIVLLRLVEE